MKKTALILIVTFILFGKDVKAQLLIGQFQSSKETTKKILKKPLNVIKSGNIVSLPANRVYKEKSKLAGSTIISSYGQNYEATANDLAEATSSQIIKKKIIPIGGIMTFPFKLRPQNGIFETTFSLSGFGGVQIPLDKDFSDADPSQNFLNLLLSFGASSITLDKNNTDPSANILVATQRPATTFSFSAVYQFEKLQLVLSTGIDNNLDNRQDKWLYQSKPWFAFGIGLIFLNNQLI